MAILTITYQGISAEYLRQVADDLSDVDVKRIAVEIIRSGGISGLHIVDLRDSAFTYFVVDRFETPEGGRRVYLRPKVPFGAF